MTGNQRCLSWQELIIMNAKAKVVQEWFETDENKFGWDSWGWEYTSGQPVEDENLEKIIITDYDKFYNPIEGYFLKS